MGRIALDGIVLGLQPVGGITTYFWELASRLARDYGAGATLGLPRTTVSMLTPQFTALSLKKASDPRPVKFARYLGSPAWGDIVHSSYYRACRDRRSRSIVTVYDFVYERYREGLAARVHAWQKRKACRQASAIACISANTRDDLLALYPEIDPGRVFVTPLAVDHSRFHTSVDTDGALADTVIFIGQRGGYKRFDLAVAAVARTAYRLAIVGPPLTADETGLLTASLPGRWRMLGRVEDEGLRAIYSSAYALIYPSDYEGFGLPVLEAQACGCPVVTSRRSSLPEVGGDAAIYAAEQRPEAYCAALEQMAGLNERKTIVERGLANAALFQWERTYEMTRQIYESAA